MDNVADKKSRRGNLDIVSFAVGILYLLGAVLLAAFVIVIVMSIKSKNILDLGATGDSINGLSAPILGLMIVIVTFLAFWVQFEANQEVRRDIILDRFETKFYELLKLHQYNVSDIDINSTFRVRQESIC